MKLGFVERSFSPLQKPPDVKNLVRTLWWTKQPTNRNCPIHHSAETTTRSSLIAPSKPTKLGNCRPEISSKPKGLDQNHLTLIRHRPRVCAALSFPSFPLLFSSLPRSPLCSWVHGKRVGGSAGRGEGSRFRKGVGYCSTHIL